ncbi:MAG TPA: ferredoxin--NADP reductase [Acidimicrobiales bacterium]|nr:ferredoxin--NADP reductase [Acidimicrobiales bacterium]
MAMSPTAASQAAVHPDHGFHQLHVREVVRETADANSFVLDIPPELAEAFRYRAGQFVTFRVHREGATYLRCYSMSSCPEVDDELKVTVKRVPGGVVSNWLNDAIGAGDVVEVTRPAGVFLLPPGDGDVVAFAGGSGITPVLSIIKQALATTTRRVRLLYANRDRDSIIFAAELEALNDHYRDRLEVVHRLDVEHGFVDDASAREFVGDDEAAEYFICGPGPFMDIAEQAVLAEGGDAGRIHIERFTMVPAGRGPSGVPGGVSEGRSPERTNVTDTPARITIELTGQTATADHYPGTTILQTARQMGMAPPFSCESGSCATCMARLVEGEVSMFVNNALTDDEVAEGLILTCQSVPTTAAVHVVYEDI